MSNGDIKAKIKRIISAQGVTNTEEYMESRRVRVNTSKKGPPAWDVLERGSVAVIMKRFSRS